MFLLIALTLSNVVSISQNILIFLWYIGIFGDISRPVLSAGLPYSHSFFLRHTPFCGSRFDLLKSKWTQSPCTIPYHQIEAAQALLHVILAAITLILSVIVILENRQVKRERPKMPLPAQYAQIKRSPQSLAVAPSVNDSGTGYMSSYDDAAVVTLPENRIPPYSYERHNRNKRAKIRPNSMPQPNLDHYSNIKAMDSEKDDLQLNLHAKRSSSSTGGRFRKSCEQQRRASMHEDIGTYDGSNEHEFGRPPTGNLTSLVSFDPKSRTLLRVREHRDSDDDDSVGYSRIGKISVDSGMYERIRSRGIHSSRDRLNSPTSHILAESRVKNISQDSVPSMMAPVLVCDEPVRDGSHDVSSADSGFPGSSSDWPIGYSSSQEAGKGRQSNAALPNSPSGRSLFITDDQIRTTEYKSNFRVEAKDRGKAIGHYHSVSEFPLTAESPTPNVPIITGTGLLV
ncbi:hypothetical protein KIN20_034368 [Parelaphostrongylus tenuis]|uniref:Uncharacterized protein n=1 Tax=Parelaphostrongylus tenuis TaxID=148309 RepID=A0AAD5WJM0_PARTN|nr:hypothetical protein KIN20_034368 [Parelaphostrongylus tenuis]